MTDVEATEATIVLMYKAYYAEMGGGGAPPDIPSRQAEPVADNVTAFRRPAPRPAASSAGSQPKPRLPVALIFICLVVVYVGIRYLLAVATTHHSICAPANSPCGEICAQTTRCRSR